MRGENEFKDQFGEIVVSPTYVERVRENQDKWEEAEDEFEAGEIVDKIRYSDIDEIDFQPESRLPVVLVKTDGEWKRLVLEDPDQAEEVYKRLRYRYQAYLQNH